MMVRTQLLCEMDDETGEICNVVDVSPDSPFRLQLPTKVTRQAILPLGDNLTVGITVGMTVGMTIVITVVAAVVE